MLSLLPALLLAVEVRAASSMARTQYAFVTCLATGAPWSQQPAGTTFDNLMTATLGSPVAGGVPSEEPDMEFGCAYPTCTGSNGMSKESSACDGFDVQETPHVLFSVRGLWLPAVGFGVACRDALGSNAVFAAVEAQAVEGRVTSVESKIATSDRSLALSQYQSDTSSAGTDQCVACSIPAWRAFCSGK